MKDKIAGKLLEANLVSQDQLQKALDMQKNSGGSIGQNLVRTGALSDRAYADFLAIDRDRFDILAVTGNSMGWHTALACAGALDEMAGFRIANTMGTLMQEHMIGGQFVYPFVDDDWVPIPGERDRIETKVAEIDRRPEHVLGLSIDLGGMLVLAGDEAGLTAFGQAVPKRDRFSNCGTSHG